MEKFLFKTIIESGKIINQVTLVLPETLLVSVLNSSFNNIDTSELNDLITDMRLVYSITQDELDTELNLIKQISEEDGQMLILDEKGYTHSGCYNIEHLNIAKSPRIAWGSEYIRIISYADVSEFFILYHNHDEKKIGILETKVVLDLLMDWYDFIKNENIPPLA